MSPRPCPLSPRSVGPRVGRASPSAGSLALALGLAVGLGCALDSDGVAGPPLGVATSDAMPTSTTSGSGSEGDDLDGTGAPPLEGPRKRRLDLAPALAADVSGTTLLVVLDGSRIEYADTQPGGSDLRFFGPEERAAYPIEIEHWDPSGRSFVWVRIDAPSLPDHLWMYYGDGQSFASIEPSAVWDGAFAAVWHMERGASTPMPDTTASGHDLQFIDFAGQVDVGGHIGLGAAFQPPAMLSEAGPLELGDPSLLALSTTFTLEAWVSPSVTADDATHSVLRKSGAYELLTLEPTSTRPKLVVRTMGEAGPQVVEAGSSLSRDQWTYLAATYRADDGVLTLYRDGEPAGTLTVAGDDPMTRTLVSTDSVVQVGRNLRGTLDEVRVSTIARSPAWIRLQHASMSDQLLTFGAPQAR